MLRPSERETVEEVRAGTPPKGWARRVDFETVRASAEVLVPRTVAIDDAVRAAGAAQLVILGAGLDGRPWRLAGLADVDAYEVDHPASQRDKRERVGERPPLARSLRYVPVDLTRDRLDTALASAGHDPARATTWVWEGVVPYLSAADVTAAVAAVAALSAPGSRLVVNYQTPAVGAVVGRLVARGMNALARRSSPWRNEPRRSSWTPAAMRGLLVRHGFAVEADDDLLTLAGRLPMPVRQRRSLRNGRVAVARRGPAP
jgi:methyltransferase (TIGR00027 family)